MKNKPRKKPTLDERVSYEVVVAGHVEPAYLTSYATIMKVQLCEEPHDRTVITGDFDQAALHGILQGVYSRGFPLISVNRVEEPMDVATRST